MSNFVVLSCTYLFAQFDLVQSPIVQSVSSREQNFLSLSVFSCSKNSECLLVNSKTDFNREMKCKKLYQMIENNFNSLFIHL